MDWNEPHICLERYRRGIRIRRHVFALHFSLCLTVCTVTCSLFIFFSSLSPLYKKSQFNSQVTTQFFVVEISVIIVKSKEGRNQTLKWGQSSRDWSIPEHPFPSSSEFSRLVFCWDFEHLILRFSLHSNLVLFIYVRMLRLFDSMSVWCG